MDRRITDDFRYEIIRSLTNEQTANAIIRLMEMFDDIEYYDWEEEIDGMLALPLEDIDPSHLIMSIIVSLKTNLIVVFRKFGLIVDREYIYKVSIETLTDIIEALLNINHMDLAIANAIEGILHDVEDPEEQLFYIIKLYANDLDINTFLTLINDYSTTIFENIRNKIKITYLEHQVDTEEMNEESNNFLNSFIKILDSLEEHEIKAVPEIINTIVINPEIIKTYLNSYSDILASMRKKLVFLSKEVEVNEFNKLVFFRLFDIITLAYIYEKGSDDYIEEVFNTINGIIDDERLTTSYFNEIDNLFRDSGWYNSLSNYITNVLGVENE